MNPLLLLQSGSWYTHVIDVGVGVVVTIIGSVLLWGRRMSKLESGLVSLDAKIAVLDGNMGSRFSVLNSTVDGRIGQLETRFEIVPEKIGIQVTGVSNSVDRLTRQSEEMYSKLTHHFQECQTTIIDPLKAQLRKVSEKVLV